MKSSISQFTFLFYRKQTEGTGTDFLRCIFCFKQISLLLKFYRQTTVSFTLLVHQTWCTKLEKKIRTHIWGYASLPPSLIYTACTYSPGISNPQHLEPATQSFQAEQRKSVESTQSLRKPQHPSTGHSIAFEVDLGLGFGSGGHNNVFFVLRTAAVENVYTRTAIQQKYMLKPWELFKDCLALNNDNASVFPLEPFRSTPSVPPPLSLQAPSPVLRLTRRRSWCVARGFPLSTRAS